MFVIFIDFQKAFDSLNRSTLLTSLLDIGIKGKIWNIIFNILSYNYLKLDNGLEKSSKNIQQDKGVTQGDPLSATLFIIYITSLAENLRLVDNIKFLMFADDLVIFGPDIINLQKTMDVLYTWSLNFQLHINNNKSKVMKFRNGGRCKQTDIIKYNNTPLEFVNEYTYLGVTMQTTLTLTSHIRRIQVKAKHAIGTIKHLQNISLNTAHEIYQMKIWPIIGYCMDVLCKDMKYFQLLELDKIKAAYYKKVCGLHKSTSNTLIFHLTDSIRTGEYIIEKYHDNMLTEEIVKYKKIIEEKNIKFVTENYTDGPAFNNTGWKLHNPKNRHLITRYTSHGFHHRICIRTDFHQTYEECFCKICKKIILDRYHLKEHIIHKQSLSTMLTVLNEGGIIH